MFKRRRSKLRRSLGIAAVVLGLLGFVCGFTLALKRRDLAESWILARMRTAGLTSPSLWVGRMEWGILDVRELRAGDGSLELEQLTARFGLRSLLEGRLEELRVRGLELRGAGSTVGPQLEALATLLAPGSEVGPAWERLVVDGARLRLDGSLGAMEVQGSGRVARAGEAGLEGEARVEATRGILRGWASLSGSGTPRALEGELVLELAGSGRFGSGGSLAAASLKAAAALRGRPDALELVARKCAELRVDGLAWEGVVALAAPLRGCLGEPDQPILTLVTSATGERSLSGRLEMAPATLDLELGEDAIRAEGETPRLSMTLAGSAGRPRLTLASAGGFVELSELGLEARDLTGSIGWGAGGVEGRARLGEIRDLSEERGLPRLALGLEARAESGGTSFALRLGDDARRLVLELAGRVPGADGPTRAELRLEPVSLGRDGVELLRLLPGLADAEAAGTLAALGSLEWGEQGPAGHVELALRELDLSSPLVEVELANGVVRLEGPSALSIPPGQLLSLGRLDFGLELLDGLARFAVGPEGFLTLEQSEWTLAGGRALASGSLDPSAEVPLEVVVEQAEQEALFHLLDLPALGGEGTLSGTITLARDEQGLVIASSLASDPEGGWIRYRPEPEDPEEVQAVLAPRAEALANFRYDELQLELAGRVPGAVDVGVTLFGANPDLGEQSPVELRFNVPGALDPRPGVTVPESPLPEEIEEQLLGFDERLAAARAR